ncbi:MAG: DUF1080 domain-containing protein [Planctomycetes bacterium]|nr:DUF1080 domain-containing protein [Planctomycetota bacterium]
MAALVLCLGWASVVGAADKPAAKDFTPLFNGQDLTGWKVNHGRKDVWDVENGTLVVKGEGGGWLMTEGNYGDFELRLEYKVSTNGNSGVALRAPLEGDPAYTGMEIQILDDPTYKGIRPAQHTGSIYDVVPPSQEATKPAGEWNRMDIKARGRRITIALNGTVVVDANLDKYRDHAAKHPGLLRTTGHLGLQSHTNRVEFRNIEVKRLD